MSSVLVDLKILYHNGTAVVSKVVFWYIFKLNLFESLPVIMWSSFSAVE